MVNIFAYSCRVHSLPLLLLFYYSRFSRKLILTLPTTRSQQGFTLIHIDKQAPSERESACEGDRSHWGVMSHFCGRCGVQVKFGAAFCNACGNNLGSDVLAPLPFSMPTMQVGQHPDSCYIGGSLGFLFLFCVLLYSIISPLIHPKIRTSKWFVFATSRRWDTEVTQIFFLPISVQSRLARHAISIQSLSYSTLINGATTVEQQNSMEQMMAMQMIANQQAQNNAMIAAAGVSTGVYNSNIIIL